MKLLLLSCRTSHPSSLLPFSRRCDFAPRSSSGAYFRWGSVLPGNLWEYEARAYFYSLCHLCGRCLCGPYIHVQVSITTITPWPCRSTGGIYLLDLPELNLIFKKFSWGTPGLLRRPPSRPHSPPPPSHIWDPPLI